MTGELLRKIVKTREGLDSNHFAYMPCISARGIGGASAYSPRDRMTILEMVLDAEVALWTRVANETECANGVGELNC